MIEYAGSHYFRSNGSDIDLRCEYPDCDGRIGSPSHLADQPMINAAHHQAIIEDQYRECRVYGMGRR